MTQTAPLLRVVSDGARVRRAASRLDEVDDAITTALRRAVPFLGRIGAPIRVVSATPEPLHEALESLPRPHFVQTLTCAPSTGAAAIALDGDAIAVMLDGLLGGTGSAPPPLSPDGLSAAQSALVGRVAAGIVLGFADVLTKLGLTLGVATAASPIEQNPERDPGESIPIVLRIEFQTDNARGQVLLALPKDALTVQKVTFDADKKPRDARVVHAVQNVEVELVAELGKKRMKLAELARLKVGDTVRFPTRVDGTANVRVGERQLFVGKPTSQNGQIALRIESRVEPGE